MIEPRDAMARKAPWMTAGEVVMENRLLLPSGLGAPKQNKTDQPHEGQELTKPQTEENLTDLTQIGYLLL